MGFGVIVAVGVVVVDFLAAFVVVGVAVISVVFFISDTVVVTEGVGSGQLG